MTSPRIVVIRSILAAALIAGGATEIQAMPFAPATPPDGSSATVDPEARRLYQEGLEHYRRGEYDATIAKLEASYERTPSPGLLYDLAQAHRLKGDCRRALDHYRRYIETGPTGILRERSLARIAEMESCLTLEPATALAPAEPPSIAMPRAFEPTSHAPTRLITVAGEVPAVSVSPRHFRPHRTAAIVCGAAALGLASSFGYFAWLANKASEDVSGAFRPGSMWGAAGTEAQQRGQASYKLEIGSAVGALIAGGIGTWLWFRD